VEEGEIEERNKLRAGKKSIREDGERGRGVLVKRNTVH